MENSLLKQDRYHTTKNFILLVEQHPVLYNYEMEEYSNRSLQETAWFEIAKEINESVTTCKERWRNIRSAFARYLRNRKTEKGCKTKYYLAKYLSFVVPFTRSRTNPSNENAESSSTDIAESRIPHSDEESTDSNFESSTTLQNAVTIKREQFREELSMGDDFSEDFEFSRVQDASSSMPTSNKRKETDPLEEYPIVDYSHAKNPKVSSAQEDPDWQFLQSILPDMKGMNNQQKAQFKLKTMQNICEILYG